MARRRKRRTQGEVELNLAAMLDMAFQLLTFFILTFKPSPVEGQISLRLPPPKPITAVQSGDKRVGSDTSKVLEGLNSLVISVAADPEGNIGSLAIGEGSVGNLAALQDRLKQVLGDTSSPFEQVIIQVGSGLRYEALMQVVDICTRQRLPNGEPLTKLSFVELPETPG